LPPKLSYKYAVLLERQVTIELFFDTLILPEQLGQSATCDDAGYEKANRAVKTDEWDGAILSSFVCSRRGFTNSAVPVPYHKHDWFCQAGKSQDEPLKKRS
jgi:hypothetical protein